MVVFISTNAPSFFVDFLVALPFLLARVPVVLYAHTTGFVRLAGLSRVTGAIVPWLFRRSSAVVVLGESMVPDIRTFLDPASVLVVIPNATRAGPDVAASPRDEVLFLSNLLPEKGAVDFVRVAEAITADFPELHFTVAGASSDPQYTASLTARAEALGGGVVVSVVGSVGEREKMNLRSRSRVHVFPSTYPAEAQPLSIIESMSAGVPVVAYDVGGVRDIVIDGQTGYCVPAGDVEALIEKTRSLISNEAVWEEMSVASRAAFEQSHSIGAYSRSWKELLAKVARLE
jgi:glycosyltransferase involved in cell wall biosynthesis